MNTIYLRRCRKVLVKEGADDLPVTHLAALQKNVESLGFVLSKPLLDRLQTLSLERLGIFYKSLIKDLRELVGAHREFKPMYPNFPEQVMEMSAARLYLNAILHYLTNLLPNYEKQPRPPLLDRTDLRVIDLGTREEFESIFTKLVGSRTSLSERDKSDLAWFAAQYRDDLVRLIPQEIPIKENLAFLGAQLMRKTSLAESIIADKVKTATDVLRLAAALSDGDVSLAEPTKFTNFRRGERKILLSWLERNGNPTEDMLRWKERWKRLGEKLHPGDYADQFPKSYAAFLILREDVAFPTFHSRVETCLADRNTTGALEYLLKRPGDLARRLDHLLRLGKESQSVVSAFCNEANAVSTPVLLQVLTHFRHRSRPRPLRTFFPKGDVAKVQAIENRLPPLPEGVPEEVTLICEQTLTARFAKLPRLGKCYLDPALSTYLVPYSQRSASKSLRTLVRGSRLPMPDAKVIRFFIWWKNGTSRTDLDLSAVLYDDNLKYVDVVSYYNLRNFGGHHSGDIVDAPKGAAEFIDLDINRTIAGGVRYVVMSLNSFTEQPYCDLPECFAGWMGRTHANSGEIFEPRTLWDKVDVASNTRICIPAVIDLVGKNVLWTDIALKKHPSWNNVQNNLSGVSLMLRALLGLVKTDLHTLFSLHIKARGERVPEKSLADIVFSVNEGITPFDIPKIASAFM
jgi:hypothetical protein